MNWNRWAALIAALLVLAGGRFGAMFSQTGRCTVSLESPSASIDRNGVTGVSYLTLGVTISGGVGCYWTATTSDAWVSLLSVTNPSNARPGLTNAGNGTLTMQVLANSGAARTGTVSIASDFDSKNYVVQQAGGNPEPTTAPSLTQISPAQAAVSTFLNLIAVGSNFSRGAQIRWTSPSGTVTLFPTTFASSATLQATISAGTNNATGQVQVAVVNPDGQVSNSRTVTITGATPAPPSGNATLTSLTPRLAVVNSALTMRAGGSNFAEGSSIRWTTPTGSTSLLPASFVNSATLQATVPANLLSTTGTAQVAVSGTDGRVSNSLAFGVISPAPFLSSVTPLSGPANSAVTIRATGSNFTAGIQVRWTPPGGAASSLSPTLSSPTQLQVSLPADLLKTPGTGQLTVVAAGVPSNSLSFTVTSTNPECTSPPPVVAAKNVVTTVAGTDWVFPGNGKSALEAPLSWIVGVDADGEGNYYIADSDSSMVMKVDGSGTLRVIAGTGLLVSAGDGGLARLASFAYINSLAVDRRSGIVYVAERQRIRKITPDGAISTFAGNGTVPNSAPKPGALAASAPFGPAALACDRDGNLYFYSEYFSSQDTHSVVSVSPDGVIRSAVNAGGIRPTSLAVDDSGVLYAADTSGLWRLGSGGFEKIGPAAAALAIDSRDGAIYYSPYAQPKIVSLTPDSRTEPKQWRSSAITGGDYGYQDGPAASALFNTPVSLAFDPSGNLLIAESFGTVAINSSFAEVPNQRIRVVSGLTGSPQVRTVAGSGAPRFGGDGGLATSALLNTPRGLAVDTSGNLIIADAYNKRLRKVEGSSGLISTFAGDGSSVVKESVPATQSGFASLSNGIGTGVNNDLFVGGPSAIRRIDSTGLITRWVGTGAIGGGRAPAATGDPASTPFYQASNPVVNPTDGTLYFANSDTVAFGPPTVYQVSPDGKSYTRLDNLTFDGGIFNVSNLAVDSAGNLYSTAKTTVRKRDSAGVLTTIFDGASVRAADLGIKSSFGTIGPTPNRMAAPASGRSRKVYWGGIGSNHGVLGWDSSGTVTVVSGFNSQGPVEGIPGTDAFISRLGGLAADPDGNVYYSDADLHRVRKVLATPPGVALRNPLSSSSTPLKPSADGKYDTELRFAASSDGAPTDVQRVLTASDIPAMPMNVLALSGGQAGVCAPAGCVQAAAVPWLRVTPSGGLTPLQIELSADPTGLAPGLYEATVTICIPNAAKPQQTIHALFTVGAAAPARISAAPQTLSFYVSEGQPTVTDTVVVSNDGGGEARYYAVLEREQKGVFSQIGDVQFGSVRAGERSKMGVAIPLAGFAPGTYVLRYRVIPETGAEPPPVPVNLTVSRSRKILKLSQRGLSFTSVSRGGTVPGQTFGVLNLGSDAMDWTATATVLGKNIENWLTVTPASGTSGPGIATPYVTVGVKPGVVLVPGIYQGYITVKAAGVLNAPHYVSVYLTVLKDDPGAVVVPSELVFNVVAGASPPSAQELTVYNIGVDSNRSFGTTLSVSGAGFVSNWLQSLPGDAVVPPNAPVRVVVQPLTASLPVGSNVGSVTLRFNDGNVRQVPVRVNVQPANSSSSQAKNGGPLLAGDSGCIADRIEPQIAALPSGFAVNAGWPVALQVIARDNCDRAVDSGTMRVRLSGTNIDETVPLRNLGGGRWDATWNSKATTGDLTLTATAADDAGIVLGTRTLQGTLTAADDGPVFDNIGVTSAAEARPLWPLAPGERLSIVGQRLAAGSSAGELSAPLPQLWPQDSLDTATVVTIRDKFAVLRNVTPNSLDIVVPLGIPTDAGAQQMLIQRGSAVSIARDFTFTAAQPSIFVEGATRQGRIYFPANQQQQLAGDATPAQAGQDIAIVCTGLGDVPGASDQDYLNWPGGLTLQPDITVSIGGVAVKPKEQRLRAGKGGEYVILATVPDVHGTVEVVLTAGDRSSTPVTMVVQ